jgi:hypothetical protein
MKSLESDQSKWFMTNGPNAERGCIWHSDKLLQWFNYSKTQKGSSKVFQTNVFDVQSMGKGFVYSYLDKAKKTDEHGKYVVKYAWYDSGALHANEVYSERFGRKQDKYKDI